MVASPDDSDVENQVRRDLNPGVSVLPPLLLRLETSENSCCWLEGVLLLEGLAAGTSASTAQFLLVEGQTVLSRLWTGQLSQVGLSTPGACAQ